MGRAQSGLVIRGTLEDTGGTTYHLHLDVVVGVAACDAEEHAVLLGSDEAKGEGVTLRVWLRVLWES